MSVDKKMVGRSPPGSQLIVSPVLETSDPQPVSVDTKGKGRKITAYGQLIVSPVLETSDSQPVSVDKKMVGRSPPGSQLIVSPVLETSEQQPVSVDTTQLGGSPPGSQLTHRLTCIGNQRATARVS